MESTISTSLSLHDTLALGEYEKALLQETKTSSSSANENVNVDDGKQKQKWSSMLRLPLFLRLLSSSQALATVKHPDQQQQQQADSKKNEQEEESDDDGKKKDRHTYTNTDHNFVDHVVRLLEVVAVSHPIAENIDLLSSYLAPAACRSISRCAPVIKKYRLMDVHKFQLEEPSEESSSSSKRNQSGTEPANNGNVTAVTNADAKVNPTSSSINRGRNETKGNDYVLGKGILCTEDSFLLTGWETEKLLALGAPQKKKEHKYISSGGGDQKEDDANHVSLAHDEDEEEGDKDVDMSMEDDDAEEPNGHGSIPNKKRKRSYSLREDEAIMDEDSLQSSVCKTLEEIVSLVASSLNPVQCRIRTKRTASSSTDESSTTGHTSKEASTEAEGAGEESQEHQETEHDLSNHNTSNMMSANTQNDIQGIDGVILTIKPDSLLSETAFSHHHSQIIEEDGGYGYDSELSAAITSIMHHAPVLRHEHLASALCRANIPQCADIIVRLAANTPGVAPAALLRGCISAHQLVERDASIHDDVNRKNILHAVRRAIKGISSLSKREALHVVCALQQSRMMPDLMLSIMFHHDPDGAVATILHEFKRYLANGYGLKDYNKDTKQSQGIRSACSRTGRIAVRKHSRVQDAFALHRSDDVWVVEAVRADRDFALSTRKFLVQMLLGIVDEAEKESIIWGKVTMVVRALGMLTYVAGIGAGSSEGSGSNFVEKSLNVLLRLSKVAFSEIHGRDHESGKEVDNIGVTNNAQALCRSCRCDNFVEAAICTMCTICCHFPPLTTESNVKSAAVLVCVECFQNTSAWCVSDQSKAFLSRIHSLIESEEGKGVETLILESLGGEKARLSPGAVEVANYGAFCQWVRSILPCRKEHSIDVKNEPINLLSLVEMGRNGQVSNAKYDTLMTSILTDATKCQRLCQDKKTVHLIESVISQLLDRESFPPPHVLPLTIERNLKRCVKESNLDAMTTLQLIYSFTFLEHVPDSPFVIDPRSLPMMEVVQLVCNNLSDIHSHLTEMIERQCPEIQDRCFDKLTLAEIGFISTVTQGTKPKDVAHVIRKCLEDKSTNSHDIEHMYLTCRAQYASIEVDTEAARAFLSYHFTTYSNLCRDPLILLQCPLTVWATDGLRRIMLAILQRILAVNEKIIHESSVTASIAAEYLASRDSLAVRCFLYILSGSCFDSIDDERDYVPNCPALISMVKQMITKRKGLVASIVKQGLPEKALDWLVGAIPETFSDADELSNILETHALTPKERLQVADGSLRIAIAHGSRNEAQSQRLAYDALSVLVSSFYLVIGPVGVPVTLTCDEQGQDITMVCRKVLFRMLSALQDCREMSERIKSEAVLALSRMASLCKSDALVGGLSGTALKKRKLLLKEVFDAIVRVNVAFGGGIQL